MVGLGYVFFCGSLERGHGVGGGVAGEDAFLLSFFSPFFPFLI